MAEAGQEERIYPDTKSEAQKCMADLALQAFVEKNYEVRIPNPKMVECYTMMKCGQENCPCFGGGPSRCWQKVGTFSGNRQAAGEFIEQYGHCSSCPVYKEATSDPVGQVGECFNNFMHLLAYQSSELEKSSKKLSRFQDEIVKQEKLASIGQLTAGIAHEINNPTGYISSNLNVMKKYLDKLVSFIDFQGEILKKIDIETLGVDLKKARKKFNVDFVINDISDIVSESIDGCERIRTIVSDLKSFSRDDTEKIEQVDLNNIIDKTINVVWNEIKYKAELVKDYGDLPATTCNPDKLSQVIMNLLVNAAHAIEERGTIIVRSWCENGAVSVSVKDTGCGISPDNINKIFDPFFTTKQEGKGTGLGLFISLGIVQNAGGNLSAQSSVGEGTTFTLELPVL